MPKEKAPQEPSEPTPTESAAEKFDRDAEVSARTTRIKEIDEKKDALKKEEAELKAKAQNAKPADRRKGKKRIEKIPILLAELDDERKVLLAQVKVLIVPGTSLEEADAAGKEASKTSTVLKIDQVGLGGLTNNDNDTKVTPPTPSPAMPKPGKRPQPIVRSKAQIQDNPEDQPQPKKFGEAESLTELRQLIDGSRVDAQGNLRIVGEKIKKDILLEAIDKIKPAIEARNAGTMPEEDFKSALAEAKIPFETVRMAGSFIRIVTRFELSSGRSMNIQKEYEEKLNNATNLNQILEALELRKTVAPPHVSNAENWKTSMNRKIDSLKLLILVIERAENKSLKKSDRQESYVLLNRINGGDGSRVRTSVMRCLREELDNETLTAIATGQGLEKEEAPRTRHAEPETSQEKMPSLEKPSDFDEILAVLEEKKKVKPSQKRIFDAQIQEVQKIADMMRGKTSLTLMERTEVSHAVDSISDEVLQSAVDYVIRKNIKEKPARFRKDFIDLKWKDREIKTYTEEQIAEARKKLETLSQTEERIPGLHDAENFDEIIAVLETMKGGRTGKRAQQVEAEINIVKQLESLVDATPDASNANDIAFSSYLDKLENNRILQKSVVRVINLATKKNRKEAPAKNEIAAEAEPQRQEVAPKSEKAENVQDKELNAETKEQIAGLQEQIRNIDAQIVRWKKIIKATADEIQRLRHKIKKYPNDKDHEQHLEDLREKEGELQPLIDHYQPQIDKLEAQKAELVEKIKVLRGATPKTAASSEPVPSREPAPAKQEQTPKKKRGAAELVADFKEAIIELRQEIASLESEISTLKAKLERNEGEIAGMEVVGRQEMKELEELQQTIERKENRLKSLRMELERAAGVFPDKAVLPVSEILEVTALESVEDANIVAEAEEAQEILNEAEDEENPEQILRKAWADAREKFYIEHNKFMKAEKEKGKIGWLMGKLGISNLRSVSPKTEAEIAQNHRELHEAKKAYEAARANLGQHLLNEKMKAMDAGGAGCINADEINTLLAEIEQRKPNQTKRFMEAEKARLEAGNLTPEEKDILAGNFEAGDLLQMLVLNERAEQSKRNCDKWPPKDKGLLRRAMDNTLLAKGKKGILCRTVVGAMVFGGGFTVGAGALIPFLGARVARTFAVGAAIGPVLKFATTKIPLLKDKSEKHFNENVAETKKRVRKGEIDLNQADNEIKLHQDRADNEKRRWIIKRFLFALGAGFVTGLTLSELYERLAEHGSEALAMAGSTAEIPITPEGTDVKWDAAVPPDVEAPEYTAPETPNVDPDHDIAEMFKDWTDNGSPDEKWDAAVPPDVEAPESIDAQAPGTSIDQQVGPLPPIEQVAPQVELDPYESSIPPQALESWRVGDAGGHDMWAITKHVLEGTPKFNLLTSAGQQDNAIATLYEKFVHMNHDQLVEMGIKSGNIHIIHDGDIIDLSKAVDAHGDPVFTSEEMKEAVVHADTNFSNAKSVNITNGNAAILSWKLSHPHSLLTEKIANRAISMLHSKYR